MATLSKLAMSISAAYRAPLGVEEMAQAISESAKYCGGYLYSGDTVTIAGDCNRAKYARHFVKDYDRTPVEAFFTHNMIELQNLENGDIVEFFYSGANGSSKSCFQLQNGLFYAVSEEQWDRQTLESSIDWNVFVEIEERAEKARKDAAAKARKAKEKVMFSLGERALMRA